MSNDVFDVFLLRGKEEENGGLTFDPETGLYLRRAEVVQEQGARDEEGRGWERAVVEERVVEEQEGGRGKRVEEQERGSGSQGITTTPWTLADEGCCSESNVPSKRFHRGPG